MANFTTITIIEARNSNYAQNQKSRNKEKLKIDSISTTEIEYVPILLQTLIKQKVINF